MDDDFINNMNINERNWSDCYPPWYIAYLNGADIPGGFQDINPNYFVIIASLVGQITGSSLPFNVQNALGNWLELAGQVILTMNAQQQYFQSGPGRFYNPMYRNSQNPFDPSNAYTASNFQDGGVEQGGSSTTQPEVTINELVQQIQKLQQEIEKLKGNK